MMMKRIILIFLAAIGLSVAVFAQDEVTEYQLGAGDEVKVTVYGEEDLSGEFKIDGTGKVSLPLIGAAIIGGKKLDEAEVLIASMLADGYLVAPRVNIEVLNFRPFYILGEVSNPGSYPYVSDMTILNAVVLASGFTYRANKKKIEVTRKIDGVEKKMMVDITVKVFPGDIIRIQERFF